MLDSLNIFNLLSEDSTYFLSYILMFRWEPRGTVEYEVGIVTLIATTSTTTTNIDNTLNTLFPCKSKPNILKVLQPEKGFSKEVVCVKNTMREAFKTFIKTKIKKYKPKYWDTNKRSFRNTILQHKNKLLET